ncbi:MAG: hypothetical protein V7746_07415 [Halioglobus sp.]
MKITVSIFSLLILLTLSKASMAATIFNNTADCAGSDITLSGGQSAAGCAGYLQKSGRGNPNPNEGNVNALELFGHSDWETIGSAQVTSEEGASEITWSFEGNSGAQNQLIFAFKQANGFSAYLVESGFPEFSSGSWTGLPNGKTVDVSHIEILGRVSEVPLPPAFILFGSALLGLVGVRRPKR